MVIASNDIAILAKMTGPNIEKFKGVSERNDALVQEITLKIGSAAGGF